MFHHESELRPAVRLSDEDAGVDALIRCELTQRLHVTPGPHIHLLSLKPGGCRWFLERNS
jgi:hypothetical protein